MADGDTRVPRWATLEAGPLADHRIFSLQQVRRRSPRTGRVGTFQVMHTPAWVNVIALTACDEVVLIRQYRHGLDAVTLEVPGGLVDLAEAPQAAAARELLEETGYAGGPPVLLGEVHPNPAIQTNVCSTWLVEGARRVAEQRQDDEEHIVVELAPRSEIGGLIRRGDISHALVVCAFHHLLLHEVSAQ